jgi:hypothetical protein
MRPRSYPRRASGHFESRPSPYTLGVRQSRSAIVGPGALCRGGVRPLPAPGRRPRRRSSIHEASPRPRVSGPRRGPKRVLVLYDFHWPPRSSFHEQGLGAAMRAQAAVPVNLYTEYLNLTQNSGTTRHSPRRRSLRGRETRRAPRSRRGDDQPHAAVHAPEPRAAVPGTPVVWSVERHAAADISLPPDVSGLWLRSGRIRRWTRRAAPARHRAQWSSRHRARRSGVGRLRPRGARIAPRHRRDQAHRRPGADALRARPRRCWSTQWSRSGWSPATPPAATSPARDHPSPPRLRPAPVYTVVDAQVGEGAVGGRGQPRRSAGARRARGAGPARAAAAAARRRRQRVVDARGSAAGGSTRTSSAGQRALNAAPSP